jgi:insertion element IS1 protein InsB
VNKHVSGILTWVLGDRSSETFKLLWHIIRCWQSYFYVTDGETALKEGFPPQGTANPKGYPVYPCFISDEDHIVSKTYMTRVEGENSRLRHPDCSTTS